MTFLIFIASIIFSKTVLANVPSIPTAPIDIEHPGSKNYSYEFEKITIKCDSRTVIGFLPKTTASVPAVIFGHGQALNESHYLATFEHLAKKGIAVIYPAYDKGFFDQDWLRMGEDFVQQTECFLKKHSTINAKQLIFSGHSKGAYVATTAAGLAFTKNKTILPSSVVVFAPAGVLESTVQKIAPSVELTVIFSDKDTIVSRDISVSTFAKAGSKIKQLIDLKSYTTKETQTALNADHFWPLTKASFAGGGSESAFHYYGSWKWLVGAAWDLQDGGNGTNPFLYGSETIDKGVPGFFDTIERVNTKN